MIDSFNKMTIKVYREVKEIIENYSNADDDYQMKVELIAVLNDMEVEDVLDLSLTTFNVLVQSLGFLYEMPQKRMPLTKYKLGGIELEAMLDIHNMTAGQFIDYQNFVKDVDKYMVELLSVFLIPKKHKYNDGYDIMEVQKVINENLSIVDAWNLSAFFLEWFNSLLKVTVSCLSKKLTKMMKKEKNKEIQEKYKQALEHLEKSGDGLLWLIEYQKQYEILGKK